MKKLKSMNELMLNTRKEWVFSPCTKVIQSKKIYSRKNKSWKKDF